MSHEAGTTIFYSALQRRLHWLVIFLLLGQYLLQVPMRDAMAAIERQETLGFVPFLVTTLHTWGGICIGAVMLWRWKLRERAVPLNGGLMEPVRARFVTAHHISLYAVILMMVASGGAHYYLDWSMAARWHELGKWLLLGLILIHIAGALLHVRQRSTVLRRMMGRNSLH